MERYIFLLSNGTSFVNFVAILRKLQLFSDGRLYSATLKIPLQPYNEKKFEVYYFRGKRRTSSKCPIYFHCPTVTKKTQQICGMKRR